jgi:hypothetical protein
MNVDKRGKTEISRPRLTIGKEIEEKRVKYFPTLYAVGKTLSCTFSAHESHFFGEEIPHLTSRHIMFRRKRKPDLPFYKIFNFGTSTKNQRIERWWDLLTTGQTEQWKKLFENLRSKGFFLTNHTTMLLLSGLFICQLFDSMSTPLLKSTIHIGFEGRRAGRSIFLQVCFLFSYIHQVVSLCDSLKDKVVLTIL